MTKSLTQNYEQKKYNIQIPIISIILYVCEFTRQLYYTNFNKHTVSLTSASNQDTQSRDMCVVNDLLHKISLVPHDKIYTLVRHIANNCNHTKFK